MMREPNPWWACDGMTSPAGQHQASSCQEPNLNSVIPMHRWNLLITEKQLNQPNQNQQRMQLQ